MATANELLLALSRAYVLTGSLDSDDPELRESFEDLREIHEALGWQVLRVGDSELMVLDEAIPTEDGDLARFREALAEAKIQELRLQEALEPEVWDAFFRRLHPSPDGEDLWGPQQFQDMQEFLGISFHPAGGPLRGMAGSIQELFGPIRQEVADSTPSPRSSTEPSPREHVSQAEGLAPPLSPSLQGKVEAFFAASGLDRDRLASEILAEASRMKDSRKVSSVADLLEVLAGPRDGNADPEGLDLAQRIISPAVASHMVARLGSIREEEERNRLIGIASGLGREMALSLADALGEARDRYQRRSFLEALSAQGRLALEMARDMVEDPRWFVVRNGVALMGEVGGEEAISYLTGPLANSDPRVRRETVLALAKVGGTDAEQLALGMLDDPDTAVRAMACRAMGVLKVEKGLKPLLRILEEDPDEDVLVECLQALGKLGDPGAVPLIEKRALGGLFSRPSKEIRVAGYRALAGIGTPHAKKLLEKAAKDSDAGIRAVVQGLLD